VRKARKILKNEIYLEMMKPYFKAGNNYKDFVKVWFEEEVNDNLKPKEDSSFFEKYLLIKIDSKYYIAFKMVILFAAMINFVFVPYNTFVAECSLESPYKQVIIFLDVLWILHILLNFMFGYIRESKQENSALLIASRYLK